jgi:hypothetical protein
VKRTLSSLSLWFALVLIAANGVAWAGALAPEAPAAIVEPRVEPGIADLMQRLGEGGHSGEAFTLEVTDREAAETLAYYLERARSVPFREAQVAFHPGSATLQGVAEMAGLSVRLTAQVEISLRDGAPLVALTDLDLAGLSVPGWVRNRIQAELDAQFRKARDLPLLFDEVLIQEGKATVRGKIR